MDNESQILSHMARFDSLDDSLFKAFAEMSQFFVVIKSSSVSQTSSPSIDTGNRVGGGFTALLVNSVMSSDCTVSSFSFKSSAGAHQDTGHKSERAIA